MINCVAPTWPYEYKMKKKSMALNVMIDITKLEGEGLFIPFTIIARLNIITHIYIYQLLCLGY